eukprot:NODE_4114_length_1227_cov_36.704710_g3618_i0.p1 GENE.NODE_4114_length_1227_cov_36.704710_g3618_i0~~NODE_4114_length_1227_cov_36.704710_g3618_i0.p1  ORF type:complete len:339 (-),score=56.64 NODE_4114_length_1227_cov_36.704710_g3618_i0:137-1153(-)
MVAQEIRKSPLVNYEDELSISVVDQEPNDRVIEEINVESFISEDICVLTENVHQVQKDTIDQLRIELKQSEVENTTLQSALETACRELNDSRQANAQLQSILENSIHQLEDLYSELESLREHAHKLKQQNSKLEEELKLLKNNKSGRDWVHEACEFRYKLQRYSEDGGPPTPLSPYPSDNKTNTTTAFPENAENTYPSRPKPFSSKRTNHKAHVSPASVESPENTQLPFEKFHHTVAQWTKYSSPVETISDTSTEINSRPTTRMSVISSCSTTPPQTHSPNHAFRSIPQTARTPKPTQILRPQCVDDDIPVLPTLVTNGASLDGSEVSLKVSRLQTVR